MAERSFRSAGSRPENFRNKSKETWKDILFLAGGVILPLLAVLFEVSNHFCARHFFDPFPSAGHVFLFLLIPMSNALAWLTRYRDISQHYGFMALASGMAAGIGLMYSLMFLPILGLSLLFALVGIGFLGLSPILSLPCTLRSGKTVCNLARLRHTYFDPHQVKHIGHLIVLVMVVAIEAPSTLTRMHLDMADNQKTAAQGIKWLRQYGSREVMLRACYERSGRATDILGSLYECARPLTVDHARTIFYRVTGLPFNTVPIPASARATIQHAGLVRDPANLNANVEDEFDLDLDIAGEVVSGVARGLAVRENTITGKLDPDALLGELNWTILLNNSSPYDREARIKMLLPRGAVVNSASLTVDNVEKEAVINVRGQARTTYVQAVTRKRKNPLLVSVSAPDQVLVQCFPVTAGHPVKVRLSMVCPLALDENKNAVLGMPTVVEKNFPQEAPCKIAVEWTGHGAQPAGRFTDSVNIARLSEFKVFVRAPRDGQCRVISCRNSFKTEPSTVRARIEREHFVAPQALFIIVDGSKNMSPYINEVADAIKALPLAVPVELKIVGDETKTVSSNSRPQDANFALALESLRRFELIAGQDDSPELLTAVRKTVGSPGAAVLWIHGAQPVRRTSTLLQYLNNQGRNYTLYDFQVEAGPVLMLDGMSSSANLIRVLRCSSVAADLRCLWSAWQEEAGSAGGVDGNPVTSGQSGSKSSTVPAASNYATAVRFDVIPEAPTQTAEVSASAAVPVSPAVPASPAAGVPASPAAGPAAGVAATPHASPTPVSQSHETSASLAQICVYDQILKALSSSATPDVQSRAEILAHDYHLVSPVSSAVVADVEPKAEENVLTAVAPEPEAWILLLMAACLIGGGIYFQKRRLCKVTA